MVTKNKRTRAELDAEDAAPSKRGFGRRKGAPSLSPEIAQVEAETPEEPTSGSLLATALKKRRKDGSASAQKPQRRKRVAGAAVLVDGVDPRRAFSDQAARQFGALEKDGAPVYPHLFKRVEELASGVRPTERNYVPLRAGVAAVTPVAAAAAIADALTEKASGDIRQEDAYHDDAYLDGAHHEDAHHEDPALEAEAVEDDDLEDFENADLADADADLDGADLDDADLDDADFDDADLDEADLDEAQPARSAARSEDEFDFEDLFEEEEPAESDPVRSAPSPEIAAARAAIRTEEEAAEADAPKRKTKSGKKPRKAKSSGDRAASAFDRIRSHVTTAAFMVLAGGLGATVLSVSGVVAPKEPAQEVAQEPMMKAPPALIEPAVPVAAGEAPAETIEKAEPAAARTDVVGVVDTAREDLKTGGEAVTEIILPAPHPHDLVKTEEVPAPPRPFLDEFALEAMLIETPIHCVLPESGEGACVEEIIYEPDAGLFYRERKLPGGDLLEINGAYTLTEGAICHEAAGLTAMVLSETMADDERSGVEQAALTELAGDGAPTCWKLRPVDDRTLEAVAAGKSMLVRANRLD